MSQPRRLGPQRQREPREHRAARRTAEAVAALEAAGGECARCRHPGALMAIYDGHGERRKQVGWTAVCVDGAACDRRFRASLLEDDE